MGIKQNLFKNAGASFFSKISNATYRLIQVPLLIYFLGVEDFGRWTVLYAIPSWLALANFGFGTVATNQMSIYVSQKSIIKARNTLSTSVVLLLGLLIAGFILTVIIVPLINWNEFLDSVNNTNRQNEFQSAVLYLSFSVFFTFFYGIIDGVFKAARKAHKSIFISSMLPWINLFALVISLNFSLRFDFLALAILISNIVFLIFYAFLGYKTFPELSFSFKLIQRQTFKILLKKGFAYQAFPLGSALTSQGNVLIIQFFIGPSAVALFSTIKTMVNSIKQVLEIINQSSWPELSHLIGEKNYLKAAKLHRYGVALSILLSTTGFFFFLIFGNYIYTLWTGNKILLPRDLFVLMLIPIPLNALWYTSSVVHLASNMHEKVAKLYLLFSLISIFMSYYLVQIIGLNGMAVCLIFVEIMLIPFVLNKSMQITQDNWYNFRNEILNLILNAHIIVKNWLNSLKKMNTKK